jgi:hypothetical protein
MIRQGENSERKGSDDAPLHPGQSNPSASTNVSLSAHASTVVARRRAWRAASRDDARDGRALRNEASAATSRSDSQPARRCGPSATSPRET